PLAPRAYRHPIKADEILTLLVPYQTAREHGTFEDGIRMALERILVSPNFLFRVEIDPPGIAPGTAYRIRDLELASRLSFFLWSTIPDDELFDIAARGRLKEPAILEQTVRRMLPDPRATTVVSNFLTQLLSLR